MSDAPVTEKTVCELRLCLFVTTHCQYLNSVSKMLEELLKLVKVNMRILAETMETMSSLDLWSVSSSFNQKVKQRMSWQFVHRALYSTLSYNNRISLMLMLLFATNNHFDLINLLIISQLTDKCNNFKLFFVQSTVQTTKIMNCRTDKNTINLQFFFKFFLLNFCQKTNIVTSSIFQQ